MMPAAGMSAAVKLELRGRRHVRLAAPQKPIPVPVRRQYDAPFVSDAISFFGKSLPAFPVNTMR